MHQRLPGEIYNKEDDNNILSANTGQVVMVPTNGGYHGEEEEEEEEEYEQGRRGHEGVWVGDTAPAEVSQTGGDYFGHENSHQTDFLDDVFGSDEPDFSSAGVRPGEETTGAGAIGTTGTAGTAGADAAAAAAAAAAETARHPSDMHRLQQDHATAGYRDGVTAAKAASIQAGFDEGYSLGAALGLAAGELLGLLEGLVAGVPVAQAQELTELLARARRELAVTSMFGGSYFAPDGTWTYEVESGTAGTDPTIFDVARAHPLVRAWRSTIDAQAEKHGVRLDDDDAGVLAALGLQKNEETGGRGGETSTAVAEAATTTTTTTTSTSRAASSTAALDW